VDLQHLLKRQKQRFHDGFRGALFRQRLEGLAVTPVGPFLGRVELRPAFGRCRGGYDQALSVGADV
jgi:hypothetical protein